MESFGLKASVFALMAALVFASFIITGDAQMADAPAPAPTSASIMVTPFAAFFASFAVLAFGSAFRW
ncbi:hypothetical protein ACHQM5_001939 [Ranunculus cassubicifolius]